MIYMVGNSPAPTLMIRLQRPWHPYYLVSPLPGDPIFGEQWGPQGGCIKQHKWLDYSSFGELHGQNLEPLCDPGALISLIPGTTYWVGNKGAPRVVV